jgi:hypothetical protein
LKVSVRKNVEEDAIDITGSRSDLLCFSTSSNLIRVILGITRTPKISEIRPIVGRVIKWSCKSTKVKIVVFRTDEFNSKISVVRIRWELETIIYIGHIVIIVIRLVSIDLIEISFNQLISLSLIHHTFINSLRPMSC